LGSVSCPAAGSCVAIGGYDDTAGHAQGLIETLSAGVWTPLEAPLPADADQPAHEFPTVSLSGLACPQAGSCVIVGSYPVSAGNVGLIETLSGATWTASQAPLPTATPPPFSDDSLTAVSCPTTDACVAVGTDADHVTDNAGVIDTLSAGTWTTSEAPLPPDASTSGPSPLSAVACAGPGSCVATGAYIDAGDTRQGLLETLSEPMASTGSLTTAAPTGATIQLGQSDADAARVEGSPADGSPGGVVTFYACGPTSEPEPCISTADAVGAPLAVSSVVSGSSAVTSAAFTPDHSGYWCFAAYYSGDTTTYLPSASTADDQCFLVTPTTSSTLNGVGPPTLPTGQSTADLATVTGDPLGGVPTGTVSFYACGPMVAPLPCTSTTDPVGTPVSVFPDVGGDATGAESPLFTPSAGGYWCLAGYYSGDDDYSASSDTTTDGCFDVPPVITSAADATFTEGGVAVPFPVTWSGGYSPVSFSETGSLPPGITFSSNGVLSGRTRRQTGSFPITITATDASGKTATQAFVLDVVDPISITTPSPLPPAHVATAYDLTLTADSDGVPCRWRITGSALPKGLRLNRKTGVISGVPAAHSRGTYTLEIQARLGKERAAASFSMSVD
ncbi:MAG: putative Ig domain-containing protein, partial [Acidimicrobiales bacterium]